MAKNGSSSTIAQPLVDTKPLHTYPSPWKGHLVLACRKCQKKLKFGHEAANLRKALKRQAKQQPDGPRLRVLQVPCLKLCPQGAVTVCTQSQLARAECSIVGTRADIEALYALCCEEAGVPA